MIQEPKNATVMEGEKVELECRALNDPDATTQWIKRNSDSGSTSGAAPNENVINHDSSSVLPFIAFKYFITM